MGWLPSNNTITVDEGDSFSYTITYIDDDTGLSPPTTVIANNPYSGVAITGDSPTESEKVLRFNETYFDALDNLSIGYENGYSVLPYEGYLNKLGSNTNYLIPLNQNIEPPFTIETWFRATRNSNYNLSWETFLYNPINAGRVGFISQTMSSSAGFGVRSGIGTNGYLEDGTLITGTPGDWTYYNPIGFIAIQVDENWNMSLHGSKGSGSNILTIKTWDSGFQVPLAHRTTYNTLGIGTPPNTWLTAYNVPDLQRKYYSIRISNGLKYNTVLNSETILNSYNLIEEDDTIKLIKFGNTGNLNTITGNYLDVFNNEIKYRTVDDQFVTVNKWQDIAYAIAAGSLSELYYYKADTTTRIVYTYTATANGHSQTYTINVDNDWTFGRNQLIKYTNFTKYQQKILVEWINSNIDKVKWLNNVIEVIDWENNNL